jgi:hypothetical protein
MRLTVPPSEVDERLRKLVSSIADKWEKYKEDFFIRDDPEGVLKASFAIGYALFVIEFMNETVDRVAAYNNVSKVQANLPKLIRNRYGPINLPGYNYYTLNSNRRPYMSASMVLKSQLLSKSYNELEAGMMQAIKIKTGEIPRNQTLTSIFKYTGYGPESKFMQAFFYHSMVIFGWYMFYGWRTSPRTGQSTAVEFPGSCNVQGCINMYIFKLYGLLDRIVYVPHGKTSVSTNGNISVMTSQRTAGTDDVQFCHHAWRVADQAHNSESGYYGEHAVKVVRSHVDAFDVLTLTPIFRAIQRLKRTGKGDRVKYIDRLLDLINSDIKKFVRSHLMGNLPGNARYLSKMTNVVQARPNASSIHYKYKKFINDNRKQREGNMTLNKLKEKYGANYNKFVKIRNAITKASINKNFFNRVNRNDLRRRNLTENEINIAMKHVN